MATGGPPNGGGSGSGSGRGIPLPSSRSGIPRPALRIPGPPRPASTTPATNTATAPPPPAPASSISRPSSAAGTASGTTPGARPSLGFGIRAHPLPPGSALKRPGSALGRSSAAAASGRSSSSSSSSAVPSTPLTGTKRQRVSDDGGPGQVFATPLRQTESIATASANRIARLSMSARRPSSALGSHSIDSPISPGSQQRGSGSLNTAALAAAELRASQAEQRLASIEAEVATQASKLERYERERLDMLHEYERSQATLQSEREQHATEVAHLRSEAAEARTESRETQRGLEEALSLAESDLLVQRNLASEAQLSQAQVTHERDQAVADARLWKDQLDAVQRENDELRARVDQALEGNDDDKRSMVALQEARSEADTYRKELSQQVRHITELEQSIASLQRDKERIAASARGVELLKEEKRSLERALERAQAAADTASAAVSERDALQATLHQWTTLAERLAADNGGEEEAEGLYAQAIAAVTPSVPESISALSLPPVPPSTATASEVVVYVATLTLTAQTALDKITTLVRSVQSASEVVQAERLATEAAQHQATEQARKMRAAELARQAAEAQVVRANEEVARVRKVLDSYQEEQRALEQARQRRVSSEHSTALPAPPEPDYTQANLARIDTLQARVEVLEGTVAQKQSQLATVTAEVEQLRQVATTAQEQSTTATRQAQEAQASLTQAQLILTQTQTDLEQFRTESQATEAKAQETIAHLTATHESALKRAESELVQLGTENAQLYDRLGRGEFDPERYKVLTLKAGGPYEKRRNLRAARLDALKAENEALLSQLEKAQEQLAAQPAHAQAQAQPVEPTAPSPAATAASATTADLVPRAVADNLRAEVEALQVSLAGRDKAMLRLRQVFTAKAGEFREAVRCLFGWKLRFLDSGQVKLVSSFSSAAARRKGSKGATTLTFASHADDQGTMRLIPDAQLDVDVEHLKDKWLAQPLGPGVSANDAIPCFLSELTQHLFESCTRVARAYGYLPDEDEEGSSAPAPAPAPAPTPAPASLQG